MRKKLREVKSKYHAPREINIDKPDTFLIGSILYDSKQMDSFIKFVSESSVQVFGTNSTGDRGANKFDYDRVFDTSCTQS